MEMLDRIDMLSRNKGFKNISQLSKAANIPYSTLDHLYRTNGTAEIKLPTVRKLAECLGVSMEYLVNGGSIDAALSEKALSVAAKYERLDEDGQSLVDLVINRELKRLHLDLNEADEDCKAQ